MKVSITYQIPVYVTVDTDAGTILSVERSLEETEAREILWDEDGRLRSHRSDDRALDHGPAEGYPYRT